MLMSLNDSSVKIGTINGFSHQPLFKRCVLEKRRYFIQNLHN